MTAVTDLTQTNKRLEVTLRRQKKSSRKIEEKLLKQEQSNDSIISMLQHLTLSDRYNRTSDRFATSTLTRNSMVY